MISDKQLFRKRRIKGRIFYTVMCIHCAKNIDYEHGSRPIECPHCHNTEFKKPITETRLFLLQRDYLKNRDCLILGEMYQILVAYSKSIIKKMLPKEFRYHYDKIDEKAMDAAALFIEYYLEKPAFKIDKSFGGYLQWKVKQVLFNKKIREEEDHLSLNSPMFDSKSDDEKEIVELTELLDAKPLFSDAEASYDNERSGEDLLKGIEEILESIFTEIRIQYGVLLALLVLLGTFIRLDRKGDMNNFYTYFGSNTKEHIDKVMLLIFEFVKEH